MDAQGGNSCPVAINFLNEVRGEGYLKVKAGGFEVGFEQSRQLLSAQWAGGPRRTQQCWGPSRGWSINMKEVCVSSRRFVYYVLFGLVLNWVFLIDRMLEVFIFIFKCSNILLVGFQRNFLLSAIELCICVLKIFNMQVTLTIFQIFAKVIRHDLQHTS